MGHSLLLFRTSPNLTHIRVTHALWLLGIATYSVPTCALIGSELLYEIPHGYH